MKVICINDTPLPNSCSNPLPIKEGETYMVVGESEFARDRFGDIVQGGYFLAGLEDRVFKKDRFIPLSNIDETELVNHQIKTMSRPLNLEETKTTIKNWIKSCDSYYQLNFCRDIIDEHIKRRFKNHSSFLEYSAALHELEEAIDDQGKKVVFNVASENSILEGAN